MVPCPLRRRRDRQHADGLFAVIAAASEGSSAARSRTIKPRRDQRLPPRPPFETDIILAQVALLEAIEAADQRGRESDQFERRVAELVRASTDQSRP